MAEVGWPFLHCSPLGDPSAGWTGIRLSAAPAPHGRTPSRQSRCRARLWAVVGILLCENGGEGEGVGQQAALPARQDELAKPRCYGEARE